MSTEADTCQQYVLPKLYDAGWTDDQISQERYFTDGRVVPVGRGHVRKPGKRADYLLSYQPGFPIAVVEAKASYKHPSAGMQQAMDYTEILGLKFAYATNGQASRSTISRQASRLSWLHSLPRMSYGSAAALHR